jgi:hypothetical protein
MLRPIGELFRINDSPSVIGFLSLAAGNKSVASRLEKLIL